MSPENHSPAAQESHIAELMQTPDPAAQEFVSLSFARLARAAPLACDTASNLLTMAIDDARRIPSVQAQFKFLMTPFEPTFVTVSSTELDALLKRMSEPQTPKGETAKPASEKPKLGLPAKPAIAARKPGIADKPQIGMKLSANASGRPSIMGARAPLGGQGEQKAGVSGGKFTLGHPKPTQDPVTDGLPTYAEMSRAFLSAVSLLVRARLTNGPAALASLQTVVRHCQLLAVRVGLTPVEQDAVLTAAWLSGLPDAAEVLNQLPSPFRLETIIKPPRDGSPVRVEARIVELVRAYEALAARDAAACRDVNKVRRVLRTAVAAGEPEVLEPFLGILMDEVFLATLDRKAGTILIVDPAEMASSTLGPPLAADGYEIVCAADSADADSQITRKKPDLILLTASLPNESGPSFCRRLKNNAATASTPVLMILNEPNEKLAAECLRAGAEDVLTKPLALELLFLKLQRLMDAVGDAGAKSEDKGSGVSGSLADMAFTDMIQILCAGGKSVEIHMTSSDREGCIYMQAGKIIHATAGDQQGEEAFYTLMAWREGRFTMSTASQFPERTINTDYMGLLMEGSKRLDDRAEQAGGN